MAPGPMTTPEARAIVDLLLSYFVEHGWTIHMDDRPGQPDDPFIELAAVFGERAVLTPLAPEVPPRSDDDLYAADVAASLVHDYIWQKPVLSGTEPPSREQASDAIWTIHKVLRPLLAATPEPPDSGDAAALDAVYGERNSLVAALAHLFGNAAWRGLDPTAPDFTIVYIDLPTGQVSWHIPDAEMDQFPPLPLRDPTGWDGHDTDEKYRRLAALRRGDICRDVAEAVQMAVNHERSVRVAAVLEFIADRNVDSISRDAARSALALLATLPETRTHVFNGMLTSDRPDAELRSTFFDYIDTDTPGETLVETTLGDLRVLPRILRSTAVLRDALTERGIPWSHDYEADGCLGEWTVAGATAPTLEEAVAEVLRAAAPAEAREEGPDVA